MGKREPRRKGHCPYCGELRSLTRDHVIPKCLFPGPLPQNMLTVPACDECNGRKARHDGFLRDLLVTDVAGAESPLAQRVFAQKTMRSHQQGKSLLARIALEGAIPVPVLKETGEEDLAFVSRFDFGRAMEMFSFVVRGLYYALRRVILPPDCEFQVGRLFAHGLDEAIAWFNEYGAICPYSVGNGVFSCVYNYVRSNEVITFWLLEFYDRVQYSVVTTPPGYRPRGEGRA
jgi:hypothetical protein